MNGHGITLTEEEYAVANMALRDWAREHQGMPHSARLIALDLAQRLHEGDVS